MTEKSSTDIWAVKAGEDMEYIYGRRRRCHERKKGKNEREVDESITMVEETSLVFIYLYIDPRKRVNQENSDQCHCTGNYKRD